MTSEVSASEQLLHNCIKRQAATVPAATELAATVTVLRAKHFSMNRMLYYRTVSNV